MMSEQQNSKFVLKYENFMDKTHGLMTINVLGEMNYVITNQEKYTKSSKKEEEYNEFEKAFLDKLNEVLDGEIKELKIDNASALNMIIPNVLPKLSTFNSEKFGVQIINVIIQNITSEAPSVPVEPEQSSKEKNKDDVTIVKTDVDSIDGQVKCPKCGATDISTNLNNGKLRCNYCRHEFDPIK